MLGFGVRQFEFFGQLTGEVIAADRHRPLPNAKPVGDDQIAAVGSDRQQHHARRRIIAVIKRGLHPLGHAVVDQHVVKRDRGQLDLVHLDVGGVKRSQLAVRLFAFHRKQSDFAVGDKPALLDVAGHQLVIPNDVVQIERDLLPGFVADDVADLFDFDRRRFEKLGQSALARHTDHDAAADAVVALQ